MQAQQYKYMRTVKRKLIIIALTLIIVLPVYFSVNDRLLSLLYFATMW